MSVVVYFRRWDSPTIEHVTENEHRPALWRSIPFRADIVRVVRRPPAGTYGRKIKS